LALDWAGSLPARTLRSSSLSASLRSRLGRSAYCTSFAITESSYKARLQRHGGQAAWGIEFVPPALASAFAHSMASWLSTRSGFKRRRLPVQPAKRKPPLKWSARRGWRIRALGFGRAAPDDPPFLRFFLRLQLSEGACQQRCPCRAIHAQDHGLDHEMLEPVLESRLDDPRISAALASPSGDSK